MIGSDEVGNGSYFGPVTVCAAYVDKSMISKLKALGVRDSKINRPTNYSIVTCH